MYIDVCFYCTSGHCFDCLPQCLLLGHSKEGHVVWSKLEHAPTSLICGGTVHAFSYAMNNIRTIAIPSLEVIGCAELVL